jgi:urease accessory protein
METTLTGEAFAAAARAWPSDVFARLPEPCPYAVAVGAIAGAQSIWLHHTLIGYLTAVVHAQISVAVRLVPLGQTAGLQVMAALEREIAALADAATSATLEDIGGIAYAADIAQMRHETIGVRVFRS